MSSLSSSSSSTTRTTIYGNYQPSCFAKEVFGNSSFSIDSFISDCRKRVPLESVRSDLSEFSTSLENELVELINKDYTDFVNLSSNLVGIDKVLSDLTSPLDQMRNELYSFKHNLEHTISTVEGKLIEREQISQQRFYLQLIIDISNSIAKIEQLLNSKDVSQFCNAYERVERIANEHSQLKSFVSKISEKSGVSANASNSKNTNYRRGISSFLSKIQPRLSSIETKLERELAKLFKQSLKGETDDILTCLRAYQAIDKVNECYEIFRVDFVRPSLASIINISALEAGTRGSSNGLDAIYHSILQFLNTQCTTIFNATSVREQNLDVLSDEGVPFVRGFDFLSHSIWVEIEETIWDRTKQIFAPGIPETFHRNYTTSAVFLGEVENSCCPTLTALNSFRSSKGYKSFLGRWNLSVYFQLRFTEISNRFESALSINQQIPTPYNQLLEQGKPCVMLATNALWECLLLCFSKDIFIYELCAKFLRLALQIIARYKGWLVIALHTFSSEKTSTIEEGSEIWSQFAPENLVFLFYDTEKILQLISSNYFGLVLSVIPNCTVRSEAVSMIEEALIDAKNSVVVLLPALSKVFLDHLSEKCISGLTPLQGITATYRMTNKAPPTKASYYVDNIVSPLHSFLTQKAQMISSGVRMNWSKVVLTSVTDEYMKRSSQLLSSLYKTDSFLKNMAQQAAKKKGVDVAGQNSENKGLSDTEKIALQLFLDVEKYGTLLEQKFEINALEFVPFQELYRSVQEYEKLKSQAGTS
eukprot:TRINITY_DN1276_c0_g1_i1.p1 TRINITY_DN1276_c0_g1~~TRINITY_DN1276_c0_g1_i1.p1  ORF type:complete len:760 (-),score=116.74 TRINITY_DN1276_c0_g1_i1:30-2309(-)